MSKLEYLSAFLVVVALLLAGFVYGVNYQSQKQSEAFLEASHSLTFIVDETCYDQLRNSTDGIIRLQFNK